ncbi:MAG TPA: hypothetical protein VJA66_05960 [Thermoanaerobaculia bacterium]
MVRQTGAHRSIGRISVLAAIAGLAASAALALGNQGPSREEQRLAEIRMMNIYGLNYGATNWSAVTQELAAHPDAAGNAAVMSIPLALGNVYLNRYETGRDPADLQRGISMFQRVAGNHAWWGGRSGSGAVVTYLDISVNRLRAECDVGAAQSQIDELWAAVAAITAEEADAALIAEGVESTLPAAGRFDPSRVSLLASAASLLAEDSRSAGWEVAAQKIASTYQSSCLDLETYNALSQASLAYNISNRKVPSGLVALFSLAVFRQGVGCLPLIAGYETSGPVAAVSDGVSLSVAIHDSEVVTFILDRMLSQFRPGSQCGLSNDDPDRTPIDISR